MSKKDKPHVGNLPDRMECSYYGARDILDTILFLLYNGDDDDLGKFIRLIETLELRLKMMEPHVAAIVNPNDEKLEKKSQEASMFMDSADYAVSKL